MVFATQTIVLDTREALLDFINKALSRENVAEDSDNLEHYLQHLFEDLASKDDAEYELSYRSYEITDLGGGRVSEAYDQLGRALLQLLKEAQAYKGGLLHFQYTRLLTHDIVLTRIDPKE